MHELPILLDPYETESANGFVLRSLSVNGMNFRRASAWLKLPDHQNIRHQHVDVWSHACGVDRGWLRRRVARPGQPKRMYPCMFMGQFWARQQSLRQQQIQVCPECLASCGHCRLSWDLVCVPACPEHRCLLVDACGKCGQPISWNRPAPEVCRCHRLICRVDEPSRLVDEGVLQWVRWVEDALERGVSASATLIPGLPAGVSIDALFRVLVAMGAIDDRGRSVEPKFWNKNQQPRVIADLIPRGLARLRHAISGGWKDLVHVTAEETLSRLEVKGSTEADRRLAGTLRMQIFNKATHCRRALSKREVQFELFEGAMS